MGNLESNSIGPSAVQKLLVAWTQAGKRKAYLEVGNQQWNQQSPSNQLPPKLVPYMPASPKGHAPPDMPALTAGQQLLPGTPPPQMPRSTDGLAPDMPMLVEVDVDTEYDM